MSWSHPFHILPLIKSRKHSRIISLLKSEDHYTILTTMRNELPLLAAYASAVREPGRSWSERIVPFIPGKTLDKLNERKGSLFAWYSIR